MDASCSAERRRTLLKSDARYAATVVTVYDVTTLTEISFDSGRTLHLSASIGKRTWFASTWVAYTYGLSRPDSAGDGPVVSANKRFDDVRLTLLNDRVGVRVTNPTAHTDIHTTSGHRPTATSYWYLCQLVSLFTLK